MMRTLIMMGLLLSTAAFAQRGGGGDMGEGGGGGRGGGLSLPSVGPARMSRLDAMTGILKLSKEQKKEVKSIMDGGQKEAAGLREELAKSRERIEEAIASGSGQDAVNQAAKAYAKVEGRMAHIELDAFARIYKLLDNEQRPRVAAVFQMMAGIFNSKNWNEA